MNRSMVSWSILALAFVGSVAVGHAQPAAPPAKTEATKTEATKTQATKAEATTAGPHDGHGAKGAGKGMMGGHGMMGGQGMMGGGKGMMGECPMMAGADTKIEVKNQPKGVTVTYTSEDAEGVARLQKAAEAMQKRHQAPRN